MVKAEWGTKRTCPNCGARYYDLRHDPIVCPKCGAAFDPYGPVELGFVTSMVAQVALDALLGQVLSGMHRIWLARRSLMEAAGGTWSDELRAVAPHALEGATIIERRWGRSARALAA